MSDENTVAIVSFTGALKREIKLLRERLKRDESMSSFTLQIEASGRVQSGEVQLKFTLSPNTYISGEAVYGSSLNAVTDELMRRRGWAAVNAPTAIAYEKIVGDDTNLPF